MKVLIRQFKNQETIVVEEELLEGDGVTINYWTDKKAATIIAIDPKGKWIDVQWDKATRKDKNGMSDCQNYTFERDKNGHIQRFYKTRKKEYTFFTETGKYAYNSYGTYLSLKIRNEYFDYSF